MDSYFLTLGGTTLDVGSWTRADPGPDWGTHDLIRAAYAENPVAEGGRLAYETVGVRRLQFPLILPSGGAGLSLAGLESLLSLLARPGAVLDVKPQGVATGEMVRFDVLTGRWEPEPQIRHWEIGVRLGTLRLDTQPFAYLPTQILLASSASVGLPGRLTVPGASVLGDIPGPAVLRIVPTEPGEFASQAFSWFTDTVAWSLGGGPSHLGFLRSASWTSAVPSVASVSGNSFYPVASDVMRLWRRPTVGPFEQLAYYDLTAALVPAYTGRYRAFGCMANDAPETDAKETMQVSIDAAVHPSAPMASAQQIATVGPQIDSALSPQLVDLGEITLPQFKATGFDSLRLRLWYKNAATVSADQLLYFHGLHLLPLDGPNGIVVQDLVQPNRANNADPGKLVIDGAARTVISHDYGPIDLDDPLADVLKDYRGGFPMVGPTTTALDLVGAQRIDGLATTYLARPEPIRATVSVTYQPRFLFLKGEV